MKQFAAIRRKQIICQYVFGRTKFNQSVCEAVEERIKIIFESMHMIIGYWHIHRELYFQSPQAVGWMIYIYVRTGMI